MRRLITMLLLAVVITVCGGLANAIDLQVKGSDTFVRLTQRLAEEYRKERPDVNIAVSGGGSGVGIAAIINGTTDIADVSRPMKATELGRAVVRTPELSKVVVALDAASFVVHPGNPVKELTPLQIADIFKGKIRNWSEVGGNDIRITLYGRQSTSGTYIYVRDEIVRADFDPGMLALQGNAEIVEAVGNDRSGIGFVGMAFASAPGLKCLSVVDAGGVSRNPLSRSEVMAGLYPFTRPLYQYLNLAENGEVVWDFVRFILGPRGQEIIGQEGFIPLSGSYSAENILPAGR